MQRSGKPGRSWVANSEMKVFSNIIWKNVRIKFIFFFCEMYWFLYRLVHYLPLKVPNNIWCHLGLFDMVNGCHRNESKNTTFVSFHFIFKPVQTNWYIFPCFLSQSFSCLCDNETSWQFKPENIAHLMSKLEVQLFAVV